MDTTETDETISRILDGHTDLFRILVREHQLMVRSYVASQLHRIDEADDIAQEVFIAAFESLDKFDRGGNFAAWIRGIARNHLLVHFRTLSRRGDRDSRHREMLMQELQYDLDSTFERQRDDAVESLLHCIAKLPDRLRRVVRAGLEGIKAPTLAEEMQTSVGAIYNLHYRANASLRECMQASGDL